MPSENLKDTISAILRQPANGLDKIFDPSDQIVDCIEIMPPGLQDLKATDVFSPEIHIQNRLGHVSVNPTDPGNTAVLDTAYVYVDQSAHDSRDADSINFCADRAAQFLQLLMDKAKQYRELSLNPSITDATGKTLAASKNFLLLGDKGSGKTFFINHLFSKHHATLNQKKVVWIRVNLVPNRGFDKDLHHWIYAQIAKIILRYYDSDSQRCTPSQNGSLYPFYSEIQQWINANYSGTQQNRYIDDLEDMRQAFSIIGNDQEIGNHSATE